MDWCPYNKAIWTQDTEGEGPVMTGVMHLQARGTKDGGPPPGAGTETWGGPFPTAFGGARHLHV